MVLCKGFLGFSDAGKAGLLMHESTHGVPSIQSEDLGYASDRMINFLDEAHAFKNTDSYTTLVMELSGLAGFADTVPKDTFTGFGTRNVGGVNVAEEDIVKRPLALAEKWCIWANQDLQFLYGEIEKAIAGGRPVGAGDAREVMASVHDRFGLTVATTKPTMADQRAVAALAERFERMSIQTFNQGLSLTKAGKDALGVDKSTQFGAATETPAGGPLVVAGEIAVGEDFFAASDDAARARLIVRALAHAMPDITLAREPAYGLFAFDRSKTAVRR
jgi:hypothetical protein